MIDLHAHILPGLDDGARDLDESLAMARLAVRDGVTTMACTPHVWPPRYDCVAADVARHTAALQAAIDTQDIGLDLVVGGDVHLQTNLLERLQAGLVPTLNGTAYFLLELDPDVLTPNLGRFCHHLADAGYRPIITHPERLRWIDSHFDVIRALHDAGLVMQATAGSLLGRFGPHAKRWAVHMLDKGMIDVLASDAHGIRARQPGLAAARRFVETRLGSVMAERLVLQNPQAILRGEPVERGNPRDPGTALA